MIRMRRQALAQKPRRVGAFRPEQLRNRSPAHDPSALVAAFGPEIDHTVRGFDDVEIVLDDHHGVALIDEGLEHADQSFRVGHMEAGSGLVENVERCAAARFSELVGQLDALCLSARKRVRRLTEMEVAESDVVEDTQGPDESIRRV